MLDSQHYSLQTVKSNKELTEDVKALNKRLSKQEKEIEDLMAHAMSQDMTMITWQAADLAFNALADFAWSQLSDAVKANLQTLGITDFSDLAYLNSRRPRFDSEISLGAKSAYRTIHEDVRRVIVSVSQIKMRVKEERHKVAHPAITAEHLEELMKRLRAGSSGSEHPVYDHIRITLLVHVITS